MKKISRIVFVLSMVVSTLNAQVYNGDFETINSIGGISNWGNVYIQSVYFDSAGNSFSDSIIYDGNFYFEPTTDAHSGNQAIKITNSYNYTQNLTTAGLVTNDSDSVYSAWGSIDFVAIQTMPTILSFYAKYLPVGPDTGRAKLTIIDEQGYTMCDFTVPITNTFGNYIQFNATIPYFYTANTYAFTLSFGTCLEGRTPSFGTKLFVDDVALLTTTGINILNKNADQIVLFPNPSTENIKVISHIEVMQYKVYNLLGDLVLNDVLNSNSTIDISTLKNGLYTIQLESINGVVNRQFVVQH